jgi:hypothetical protein
MNVMQSAVNHIEERRVGHFSPYATCLSLRVLLPLVPLPHGVTG